MQASEFLSDWPVDRWGGHRLLVAVSGGADSVALMLALAEIAAPEGLVIAHFNHAWRGAESLADQRFVLELARRLGVQCVTNATPLGLDLANQNDLEGGRDVAMLAKASEESARQARYQFLIEAAYRQGAGYVVTAHTADDRVETLLHNLMRGTGLAGAAGISQFRALSEQLVLVRPLLHRTRGEVLQFLAQRNQGFRTDSSNANTKYGRNFIRHQLLPEMLKRYPTATQNLLSFTQLAEETLTDLNALASNWRDVVERTCAELRAQSVSGNRIQQWPVDQWYVIPLTLVSAQPWSVLREALRKVWLERGWPQAAMSKDHWHALRTLLESSATPAGKRPEQERPSQERPVRTLHTLPGGISVQCDGRVLALGRCSIGLEEQLS